MPDEFGMTHDNYRELLDLIAGRGRWGFFGGGIHTWPGREDEQQGQNHKILCEMERRGWVKRVIDEPDHCCFKATGKEVDE